MAWVKLSDKAHQHPVIGRLACTPGATDALVWECMGHFMALCAYSAMNLTDMVVDEPALRQQTGSRYEPVRDAMLRAGLLMAGQEIDGWPTYALLHDEDGLCHVKSRLQIEVERRRDRDSSNTALTIPVKLRDGDACRYCGLVVSWANNGSGKRATYDHLVPDGALEPTTADAMVIACHACNTKLGAMPYEERMTRLLRAPATPYYRESTLKFFEKHQVKLDGRSFEPDMSRWQPATETVKPALPQTVQPANGSDQAAGAAALVAGSTPASSDDAGVRGDSEQPESTRPRITVASDGFNGKPSASAEVEAMQVEWPPVTREGGVRVGRQPAPHEVPEVPEVNSVQVEWPPATREGGVRVGRQPAPPTNKASPPEVEFTDLPRQCPGSQGREPGLPGSGRDGTGRGEALRSRTRLPAVADMRIFDAPTDLPDQPRKKRR